jgi:hypothetical protein
LLTLRLLPRIAYAARTESDGVYVTERPQTRRTVRFPRTIACSREGGTLALGLLSVVGAHQGILQTR